MHPILRRLGGGDRRSIGRSDEIVAEVLRRRELFRALLQGLFVEDDLVSARAGDAVEKITRTHPEYVHPFKQELIALAENCSRKETRWHMAQMLPRLELERGERHRVMAVLSRYLTDSSSIVKTFAMQALADLARQDSSFLPPVRAQLKRLTKTGTPAMQSRGKKLLVQLGVRASRHGPASGKRGATLCKTKKGKGQ